MFKTTHKILQKAQAYKETESYNSQVIIFVMRFLTFLHQDE